MDTGYGNALTVKKLLQDLQVAGVSGIFLEDQKWPKRCGHMKGKEVVQKEEYAEKLAAAVDAKEDKDFIIVARTDARATEGLDEAIERGKYYKKIGADLIFVEAPKSIEEMKKIGIDFSDPSQTVGTMSGGQRQTLAIARAIYFGAKVLILDEPTSALGQKQQMEVLKTIKRVRARGDIAIVFITHNEIHSKLIADRYTFLALGKIIGAGTKNELAGGDIRRLMAGGAEMADLEQELSAI